MVDLSIMPMYTALHPKCKSKIVLDVIAVSLIVFLFEAIVFTIAEIGSEKFLLITHTRF